MQAFTLPDALLKTPGQPAIRLEFARIADRVAHRISHIDRMGRIATILESLEGEVHRNCPPSPAFQEIRQARIVSDQNRGDAVMLLGAAGGNHWSACVSQEDSPVDDIYAEEQILQFSFDVACRCQGPVVWLGATYRIAAGIRTELHDGAAILSAKGGRIRVMPLTLSGANTGPSCKVGLRDAILELTCSQSSSNVPTTLRWRYAVELAE